MPAIRIVHADDDLLVVDKPAGVLVVPAPGRGGQTVVDRVSTQEGVRAVAVHRLDEPWCSRSPTQGERAWNGCSVSTP
jgi:23S rRNA-/tRNA-specific pseudouridylate synthase